MIYITFKYWGHKTPVLDKIFHYILTGTDWEYTSRIWHIGYSSAANEERNSNMSHSFHQGCPGYMQMAHQLHVWQHNLSETRKVEFTYFAPIICIGPRMVKPGYSKFCTQFLRESRHLKMKVAETLWSLNSCNTS